TAGGAIVMGGAAAGASAAGAEAAGPRAGGDSRPPSRIAGFGAVARPLLPAGRSPGRGPHGDGGCWAGQLAAGRRRQGRLPRVIQTFPIFLAGTDLRTKSSTAAWRAQPISEGTGQRCPCA